MVDEKKRAEILKNYKASVKKAKFAPLWKNPMNFGNPAQVREETMDSPVVDSQNIESKYLEFKIKKLEEKVGKLMVLNAISAVIAIAALYVAFQGL
ncbi:MAG TPA: hypothetical protein DHN33_12015 [Eubacteriaceae bacterium]|nr:hypothetical protein [Eubacteriaceae bacterium]